MFGIGVPEMMIILTVLMILLVPLLILVYLLARGGLRLGRGGAARRQPRESKPPG